MKNIPRRADGKIRGFTLIELLVVIAIIAILAVVVVLVLNPAELLKESRDANRLSDMATLNDAIGLYQTDQSAAPTFSIGATSTVYMSVPDPAATSTAGTNCGTMGLPTPGSDTWHCVASSTSRAIDTTGWVPINFSVISSGAPFGVLPVDPTNNTSSKLYYTYTTNGTQYELTAALESAKYNVGGSGDVISSDGSSLTSVYAKGTNLALEPLDYGANAQVAPGYILGCATQTTSCSFSATAGYTAIALCTNGHVGTITISSPGTTWTALPQVYDTEVFYTTNLGSSGPTSFICSDSGGNTWPGIIVTEYAPGSPLLFNSSVQSSAGTEATYTSPVFNTPTHSLVMMCAHGSGGGPTITAGTIGGVAAIMRNNTSGGTPGTGCEEAQFTTAQTGITATMNGSGGPSWGATAVVMSY